MQLFERQRRPRHHSSRIEPLDFGQKEDILDQINRTGDFLGESPLTGGSNITRKTRAVYTKSSTEDESSHEDGMSHM
jgi:hypothetical protein